MKRITAHNIVSVFVVLGMGSKLASFQLAYLNAGEIAYNLHALSTAILALCCTIMIPSRRGRTYFSPIAKVCFNVYAAAECFNLIKELNGLNEIAPSWHHLAFWSVVLTTIIASIHVLKHRNES